MYLSIFRYRDGKWSKYQYAIACLAIIVLFINLNDYGSLTNEYWKYGTTTTIEDEPVISFTRGTETVVCTVVRDGEPYIDEWVDYHNALGFAKFYIYVNEDYTYLQKWSKLKGDYVTVIHYPSVDESEDDDMDKVRIRAYQNCTETLTSMSAQGNNSYTWVTFLDIDEFLVFKNTKYQHVDRFLRDYCPKGVALAINWLLFGKSRFSEYSPVPITKRCNKRMKVAVPYIKLFVRIEDIKIKSNVSLFESAHWVPLNDNVVIYDTKKNVVAKNQDQNPNGPFDVVALHHYFPKSRKEMTILEKKWIKQFKENDTVVHIVPREATILKEYYDDNHNETQFDVYDDMAWLFLRNRVPLYRFYDMSFHYKRPQTPQ